MTEWLTNFVNTYVVQFAIDLVLAVLILIVEVLSCTVCAVEVA